VAFLKIFENKTKKVWIFSCGVVIMTLKKMSGKLYRDIPTTGPPGHIAVWCFAALV
jgi:hypothetical protein